MKSPRLGRQEFSFYFREHAISHVKCVQRKVTKANLRNGSNLGEDGRWDVFAVKIKN